MLDYKQLCDMSHYQKDEIFSHYLNEDNAIILKATQGVSYIDNTLYKRFLACLYKKVEFFGIYHYLDKKYNAQEQAIHFFTLYKKLYNIANHCNIKLIPILDYEEGTIQQYNEFKNEWYKMTKSTLVTYTSVSWLKNIDTTNTALWVGGWTISDKLIQDRIDTYPTCILYQYAIYSKNGVTNWSVDRNYLIKDRLNLLYFEENEE